MKNQFIGTDHDLVQIVNLPVAEQYQLGRLLGASDVTLDTGRLSEGTCDDNRLGQGGVTIARCYRLYGPDELTLVRGKVALHIGVTVKGDDHRLVRLVT